MLPDILQKGFENVRLLRNMILLKQGFSPNGTVDETKLWCMNRSSTGLPPIALGEICLDGNSEITPSMIGECILDLDHKPLWDLELQSGEVIFQAPVRTDDGSVARFNKTWIGLKPKPGISGRDFVYNVLTICTENEFCAVSWSVDDIDCPMEYRPGVRSPKHTRARLILGGFLVQKRQHNEIVISYLTQVETGISGWLVDPIIKKTPKLLNGLKMYITER
jgi:hypothetical protein